MDTDLSTTCRLGGEMSVRLHGWRERDSPGKAICFCIIGTFHLLALEQLRSSEPLLCLPLASGWAVLSVSTLTLPLMVRLAICIPVDISCSSTHLVVDPIAWTQLCPIIHLYVESLPHPNMMVFGDEAEGGN